jgi:hypothetical protein
MNKELPQSIRVAAPAQTDAALRELDNPSLSLADDTLTHGVGGLANPQGTVKGYNPYDSGKLGGRSASIKKDLRKLGEWLTQQRHARGR